MKTNPSLLEELSQIRSHLTGSKTASREPDPLSAFFFAMEGLSEMVVITDLKHKIVYVNAACRNVLGYDPMELMGRRADKYFEGIPGNPLNLADKMSAEASGYFWEGELINRRKDGELITVNLKMTPLADASGKVLSYVGISEDITARKRGKDALRMSEGMLRLVLSNIPQAVFWKDRESRYLGGNKALAEIVGLDDIPASNQEAGKGNESGEIITGKGRVLLLDDDRLIREVGGRLMTKLGYMVETASEGEEAVEKFRTARESGNPFAAVILDLTVKGGMGGEEALRKLKEIDPEVKAIVSSGYSIDSVMSNYKEVGFTGVMAKPYSLAELSRVLGEVLKNTDSHE